MSYFVRLITNKKKKTINCTLKNHVLFLIAFYGGNQWKLLFQHQRYNISHLNNISLIINLQITTNGQHIERE